MTIIYVMLLYIAAITIPLCVSVMIVKESLIELYKSYLPPPAPQPKLAPFFFDPQQCSRSGITKYHVRERAAGDAIVFTSNDLEETEKWLVDILRITETYKYKDPS